MCGAVSFLAVIMSKKLPAFQLYPGDWLKDPRLSMCTLKTRGVWIDLICAMHELDRSGSITGSLNQLARICRCTSKEVKSAIDELISTKTANVTHNNGVLTVINRRMKREYNERISGRERQAKHRKKTEGSHESNDKITPPSSVSPSSSTTKKKKLDAPASLLKIFGNEYKKIYNVEYHANFGKDGKLLKALEDHYGKDEVIEGIKYFFTVYVDKDKFAGKNPTVGIMHHQWNGMVAMSTKRTKGQREMQEFIDEN